MLAQAGVQDALLAYQPVGPNIARVVRFLEVYPQVRLAVCVDHAEVIAQLGTAVSAGGRELDVLLDLELGLQRTGVPPGPAAVDLYRQIARTRGLRPAGLHAYDGHLHQSSYEERAAAVRQAWTGVAQLRDELRREGCPVPKIVAGGTGTFPVYAAMPDPELELSPGTPIFYDAGYRETFPDLPFQVAAMLLTRVVSRPAADLVTFDLGYKACASDPPAGRRLVFPEIPDAREVRQNEEHLVIQTSLAERFRPGDEQLAIPRHICPTVALHRQVQVVSGGRVIGCWEVAARDRLLSL